MPDDISSEFEKRHLKNLQRKERQIRKFYENAIHEITLRAGSVLSFTDFQKSARIFRIKDFPTLLKEIERQIEKLHASIYSTILNGIEESWALSNKKNNLFVDKRLAGKKPSERARLILYDPNRDALNRFLERKSNGMNLSDRVWSTLDNYRTEMELSLGVGISEGRSSNELAGDLRRYLKEPDRLFRKVRNAKGELRLSKAAREYHPGQGVYRSSFLNAKRVAVSETNAAYRVADYERWQKMDFIIGFKVNLSNNHPKYDICDPLAVTYPKDFKFGGWHPHCRCFVTPIQISDDEYEKYEDALLGLGEAPQIKQITELPKAFTNYVKDNAERINGWSNLPYWAKDNLKVVGPLLK